MNKKIKAFTLVELVVSIVIISILSTIGFVSFSLYTKDARDSVRISDLKNIEKSMSLLMSKGGDLVKPDKVGEDEETESKYGLTWEVGVFGNNNIEKTSLNDLPLDPKTKQPYKYLYNGDYNYYILETELENGEKVVLSNFKGINEKFTDENCFLYSEKDDGTLSITGLKNECLNILDIKIPYEINGKKVKEILNFSVKTTLSIYGPSIEVISDYAFGNSNNLEKIDFPNLRKFGSSFVNNNLTELNIPKVTFIGYGNFAHNKRVIKELNLPELTIMRDGSIRFADIDFINLPKLTIMEDYSFEYGEIGTLNVPNVKLLNLSGVKIIKSLNGFSVEEIKSNHATSTKIFSMKVPNLKVIKNSHNNLELPISDINFSKIEYIGDCNFFGSLPSGLNAPKLKHIGNLSFNRSGINGDIFLPSLEYIGRDAFPDGFTGTITIPSSFDDSNYQWPSGATIIKK